MFTLWAKSHSPVTQLKEKKNSFKWPFFSFLLSTKQHRGGISERKGMPVAKP